MKYAPPEHWDREFRQRFDAGDDLDWREQWTGAFAPVLRDAGARRVLDLGCGTGNDVLRLAAAGFAATGLDCSREAIRQAAAKAARSAESLRTAESLQTAESAQTPAQADETAQAAKTNRAAETGTQPTFVVADMARSLPFADSSFDAVMSNVAVHMFPDGATRAIFANVRRLLAKGGLFLFHVNSTEDRPLRAQRRPVVRELAPDWVLEQDGQTMRFFSRAYLLDLLSGWSEVSLEPVEITHRHTGEPFKRVWRGAASR